jgi:hypothetical protein
VTVTVREGNTGSKQSPLVHADVDGGVVLVEENVAKVGRHTGLSAGGGEPYSIFGFGVLGKIDMKHEDEDWSGGGGKGGGQLSINIPTYRDNYFIGINCLGLGHVN